MIYYQIYGFDRLPTHHAYDVENAESNKEKTLIKEFKTKQEAEAYVKECTLEKKEWMCPERVFKARTSMRHYASVDIHEVHDHTSSTAKIRKRLGIEQAPQAVQ